MMRRLCVCPGRPFVEVAVVPPVYRIVCVHPLARRPVHQRVWAMRAAAVGGSVCLCSRSFSRSWFVCFCPERAYGLQWLRI